MTKPHIGIFGRRNCGKSSLINFLTAQDIAIVSELGGTTTDPVKKSVEIFGIGPVVLIDTAGIDDEGDLGSKRVQKSMDVISKIDCALLVIANNVFGHYEADLIRRLEAHEVPYMIVHNKSDVAFVNALTLQIISDYTLSEVLDFNTIGEFEATLITDKLREIIPPTAYQKPSLFAGLIQPKDVVLLITPIDSEAPDGRMILPQNMAIRDVLDNNGICIVVKETEIEDFLKNGIKPALAVTDSQAFGCVSKLLPIDIPLTGFSVLFARIKGDFDAYLSGTPSISELKDGDKVLILESCTHQVSCDDIGRFKLPTWLRQFTSKQLEFKVVAGLATIDEDIRNFALIIQCGGCMVTRKQLTGRLKPAIDAGIPVANYGLAIAYMNGIFERATAPFLK